MLPRRREGWWVAGWSVASQGMEQGSVVRTSWLCLGLQLSQRAGKKGTEGPNRGVMTGGRGQHRAGLRPMVRSVGQRNVCAANESVWRGNALPVRAPVKQGWFASAGAAAPVEAPPCSAPCPSPEICNGVGTEAAGGEEGAGTPGKRQPSAQGNPTEPLCLPSSILARAHQHSWEQGLGNGIEGGLAVCAPPHSGI